MRRIMGAMAVGVAVLLAGAPAGAHGPPALVQGHDEVSSPNPCTGADHTLSFDIVIRAHVFDNEVATRHHENSHFAIDVTTDDGFSGRSVGPFIDNGSGLFDGEEGTGMVQSVFNITLGSAMHQRIAVHGKLHANQVDGEVITFIEDFSVRCLGKPV